MMLAGDGGDELFGGNERYVSYCRKHFWESIRAGRGYEWSPAGKMREQIPLAGDARRAR